MKNRIKKLKGNLDLSKLDGLLLFKPVNRRYYASFTGTSGFIYSDCRNDYFLTDSRYIEQAKDQCKGFEVIETSNDHTVFDFLAERRPSRLFVEESNVTMAFQAKLEKSLKNTVLVGLDDIIASQRIIKDNIEIEKISIAANIADKAFSHIVEFIRPGLSEIEIAFELEFFMRRNGASGLSFETIVASGKRSSMPHGTASDKIVEKGEFITMDFGCVYEGYCSDMTRTVHLGAANQDEKSVYGIVLKSQKKALEYIREGALANSVDKIARDIIIENGYGDFFGHGLGHGVGLEVHEEPRLSPGNDKVLSAGMVVTDEPGIYLPGKFGVRIEDLIAVKNDSCEILSNSPKELIEI